MAEANKPQADTSTLSTESGPVEETSKSKSKDNLISLPMDSDAMMDSAQPRDNRYSLSTGSDAMDAVELRYNRMSLSASSDAIKEDTQLSDKRHTLSTGSDAIPDKEMNVSERKAIEDFQALLENLAKKSDNVLHMLLANLNTSEDYYRNALHDIDAFRREINDELDKLKGTLVENIEKISARNKVTINSATDQISFYKTELQQMSTKVKTLQCQNQHCQVMKDMEDANSKLAYFQQQLTEAENINVTAFGFKPSADLQSLVMRKDALGELTIRDIADIRATHVADIKVKTKGDKHACWIYGSTVLSKNRLVIVDYMNHTVKLVDTEGRRVLSEYKPGSIPYDVARVKYRIAVTLPDARKILLMSSDDGLKLDREIHVDGGCSRITYTDNKLVVGCRDPPEAVKLLSMTGQVLQTFSTSSTGEALFSDPPRVTVSPFTKAIYAADFWPGNRMLMLDMDGRVIAEYQDADLNMPSSSVVDELGIVYVSGRASHNVHVLTPGCSKVKILLASKDGVKWPHCLSYCKDTRRLYVGMQENNTVKVYQLS